jgi:hypothetical protein
MGDTPICCEKRRSIMKKGIGFGILMIILLTLILPVLVEPNWGSNEPWAWLKL